MENKKWKTSSHDRTALHCISSNKQEEKYTIEYDDGQKETINLGDWCHNLRRKRTKNGVMQIHTQHYYKHKTSQYES